MYSLDLETHDYIDLNWKCPGRKSMKKTEEKEVFQTPAKEMFVLNKINSRIAYNIICV